MNAKEELKKWKDDFAKAKTEQAKSEHKRRFNAYVNSLSPSDKKEFLSEFKKGAEQAVDEAKKLAKIAERKKILDKVLDFASMSYIAEHYFGKSRQWLYQRINGNVVNGKPVDFTQEELKTLSFALSELGDVMKNTSFWITQ
ncbi:DUF5053 domain-containing protein [uncultured Bacteroides sp.]|uniref:DUF5053 domain-containing protein n=1 Tax=uncultured Bacteroides sp. TaxID=162156 RepID=UPI0025EA8BD1|nr:DUF5053 domain-containing protein [uncultured Bacteroides sp.]